MQRGGVLVSIDENKAIIRRFGQVWGRGSLATVDEFADPSFSVYYPLLGEPIRGSEGFKQFLTQFHAAFPDVEVTLEDVIAEDDKVVVRWTLRGTHQRELLGIQPTGKRVAWTGITIYRLARGKVVEERGEEDALGLLRQLGVIPA
jgi:steroid delta-isomerase-like uncharacterized protein